MRALVLDTETTGLIENRTVKLTRQPHLTEYYGWVGDIDTGEMESELHRLVKPGQPIPADNEVRTGITNEMVAGEPPFAAVSHLIRSQIEAAELVIGQNLSFDVEMIDLEFERIGEQLSWPRKKICTVEQTIHLRGYRLGLSDLHEHLFGERFDGAHRANNDVMATVRCCVELRRRGVL